MATIKITISDKLDGNVEIKCEPTFETMAMMINSGHPSTPAHGYAMAMIHTARDVSKANKIPILLPRIGRD